jgi:choline-glycine betaine transporter
MKIDFIPIMHPHKPMCHKSDWPKKWIFFWAMPLTWGTSFWNPLTL